jgi:hypothetical protein
MSNALTTAARPLVMDASAKAVLMALCDMAREPDDRERPCEAWPPMHGQDGAIGLCDWTCLKERAVQLAVRRLVGEGIIARRQLRHGVIYTVLLLTPASNTGVPDTGVLNTGVPDALTPAANAPKAPQSITKRKKTTSSPSRPQAAATGSRLALDFAPPTEWTEWAAAERGWTTDDARAEADVFRDYWVAQPGAAGRKTDWLATWRNWVRRSRRQSSITGGKHGQRTFGDRRGGGAGAARDRGRPLDGFVAALREVQAGGNADDDGRG